MADETDHNKQEGNKDGNGMGMRGVTKPMAEKHIRDHNRKMYESGNNGSSQGHGMMSDDMREKMLHMHHMQTLWIYWAIVMLGFWMILSPLTFDYGRAVAEPSGGREVWLSLEQRIRFMQWSDIISGFCLILSVGARSLQTNPIASGSAALLVSDSAWHL